MSVTDVTYYRLRAEVERTRAQLASHQNAARAHAELADAYFSRVAAADPQGRSDHA